MKAIRKIALVSDTHVGSDYAVFPPGITTAQGETLEQNYLQVALYKYWLDDCKEAHDYGVDTIIHFGDGIEGGNRKENAAMLKCSSLELQKAAVVELLKPLVTDKKFYMIKGSGYHHSLDTDIINSINDKLLLSGATIAENLGDIAYLNIEGFKVLVRHGADSAVIYTSRKLEAEIREQMVDEARGVVPVVNMMVRGHLHNWNYIEKFGRFNCILPAWKTFAPDKIHLKNPLGMIGDIGMVLMTIYDDMTYSHKALIHKVPIKELSEVLLK